MSEEYMPLDEMLEIIARSEDPTDAFENILALGEEHFESEIWGEFMEMELEDDIDLATEWLQKNYDRFPQSTGIWLGVETAHMDDIEGMNLEVGFSKTCNPADDATEWSYDCADFGEPLLLPGLYEVAYAFELQEFDQDEREYAEYLVCLGYTGLVLREALKKLKSNQDFMAIWGFVEGDAFGLLRKKGSQFEVITHLDAE